eukprot:12749_1
MFLFLITVIHFLSVSSDCHTNSSEKGLGIEVILGGQYRNQTLSLLDVETKSQRCQQMIKQTTIFPGIFNWASHTKYNQTDIINEDVDEKRVLRNTEIITFGSLVLCNALLCPDLTRIGPSTSTLFMQYRPVSMNTDFNISHIIHAPSIANESNIYSHHTDEINIMFWFYVIHYNHTNVIDVLYDTFHAAVIKDIDYITSVRSNGTVTTSGIIIADYRDVSAVYEHLGDPHEWNTTYYQHYIVPEDYSDVLLYYYGVSVLCSNPNICDVFLSPIPDEFLQEWKMVAILFIILFLIAVAIIACLLCKLGTCRQKALTSGYKNTDDDGADIEYHGSTR